MFPDAASLISLIMVTTQRPSITLKPRRNLGRDSRRTHAPCDPDAIQQVRKIAAHTGLSQREIVTVILTKTDLATFIQLWTNQRLESPTDIYRQLGDGMTVKTATVSAPRRSTGNGRLPDRPDRGRVRPRPLLDEVLQDTDAAAGGEHDP